MSYNSSYNPSTSINRNAHNTGTELVQTSVRNCKDALTEFGEKRGNRVSIVCTVRNGSFPFVLIPSGCFAIKSIRGRQQEKPMEAGFHAMLPWEKVQYIITSQYTVFDTPCQEVPTADNVMVKIDVCLVFRIVNAREFIINLSPEKLGDLLKAAQEEAVRNIARKTTHDKIYDLVKFDETEIIQEMNNRFQPYGVEISDVMITDVALPQEMANTLESETTYQSKQRLQKRTQEFEIQSQKDEAYLKDRELYHQNARLAAEEEAKKQRALISKEVSEIQARTAKRLAEIKAEEEAIVRKIEEEAKLASSKLDAQKEAMLLELGAKAIAEREQLNADTAAYVEQTRSAAMLQSAQNISVALRLEAEAEEKSAAKIQAKRKYELQTKQSDIIGDLANNQNAMITGKTNGNLMAQVAAASMAKSLFPSTASGRTTTTTATTMTTTASK